MLFCFTSHLTRHLIYRSCCSDGSGTCRCTVMYTNHTVSQIISTIPTQICVTYGCCSVTGRALGLSVDVWPSSRCARVGSMTGCCIRTPSVSCVFECPARELISMVSEASRFPFFLDSVATHHRSVVKAQPQCLCLRRLCMEHCTWAQVD